MKIIELLSHSCLTWAREQSLIHLRVCIIAMMSSFYIQQLLSRFLEFVFARITTKPKFKWMFFISGVCWAWFIALQFYELQCKTQYDHVQYNFSNAVFRPQFHRLFSIKLCECLCVGLKHRNESRQIQVEYSNAQSSFCPLVNTRPRLVFTQMHMQIANFFQHGFYIRLLSLTPPAATAFALH